MGQSFCMFGQVFTKRFEARRTVLKSETGTVGLIKIEQIYYRHLSATGHFDKWPAGQDSRGK
jgi:hypothetical protein